MYVILVEVLRNGAKQFSQKSSN